MTDWNDKTTMNDEERLDSIKKALKLIRSVEFSYPPDSDIRKMLYQFIVDSESLIGMNNLSFVKRRIERAIKESKE
jgi:hypothetical protein